MSALDDSYLQYKNNLTYETKEDFGKELLDFCTAYFKTTIRGTSKSSKSTLEDAIGDSLVYIWENLNKYKSEKSPFSAWVSLVCCSDIRDRIRLNKHHMEEQLSPNLSASDVYGSIEARLTLDSLVKKLPMLDQEFVRLKLEGYTDAEIGDKFGHNMKWASNRFLSIKKKLSNGIC